ncbi:MAG: histidine--tRNA ligase [Alphaproteobacteria bacterium]|nr:histidine--tRNA ligase [Alphaproteobacteria bacterium]
MAKKNKRVRPAARLPKGFRDIEAAELRATQAMLAAIRETYERYGFEGLETPAFEYTDALGKFLPDSDRPNEGVFSLQDEDERWMSLRYDLTAPLARYVAENYDKLPKPFRRFATGTVWRNEKPGPGRFRQFTQFDADTVGTQSVAADAEICMLAADTMEALGIGRGEYQIRVNSRKVLDGVLEGIGIDPADAGGAKRLTILRAVDKLDRLGAEGVSLLLGGGRKDESGDFTSGAGLEADAISRVLSFVEAGAEKGTDTLNAIAALVENSETGREGVAELRQMQELFEAAGYADERVRIDPSIVRGLDYYTGPVFEAELTFEVNDEKGRPVRFGSVGGGGRYDDLVARFTGQSVPATGFSIGVSRLQAALAALGRVETNAASGPVVVLVMDRSELPRYQRMAGDLRAAGVRAEMYLGTSGMKAQMKYADKRGAPCVIIQGSDERESGEVQIKDLIEGAKAAQSIADNKEWKESRPAQVSVPEADLVEEVKKIIARHC